MGNSTSSLHKRAGILVSLLAGFMLLGSQSASAVVIMVSQFNDNDCSEFFGTGIDDCQIVGDTTVSPVIANFAGDLTFGEANSLFPSVTGNEWSFSTNGLGNSTGDWIYTPTGADPGIKFWAANAGNDFKLFWEVSDADADNVLVCGAQGNYDDTGLIGACLDAALVVTTGSWTTPPGGILDLPMDMSHLTFYGTAPTVPEPSTLALLALGLLGFGYGHRRSSIAR